MSVSRRFLVASSLARLIRKERGGHRVTEGYFPNQADRSSYVHVEGEKGSLVLVTLGPGSTYEERTEVPRAHAEALLDVTPGKVDYVRSVLSIGNHEININRFVSPGPLDVISIEFENDDDARDFRIPLWFGPEVTGEPGYHNRSIALEGQPAMPDVALSNAALSSLLDLLENRYVSTRPMSPARAPSEAPRQAPPRPQAPVERDQPAPQPQQKEASAEERDAAADDALNLNIEDNVIRELARSLRPQRR
jgi:CYTH domain-containing protein